MTQWLKCLALLGIISFSAPIAYANPDNASVEQIEATPRIDVMDDGQQSSFLVISDIHLNHFTHHVMSFSPKTTTVSNDLDVPTFEQLVDRIRIDIQSGNIDSPQFILLLGDLSGHVRYTKTDAVNNQKIVMSLLKTAFPDKPIFYSFGNNDSFITDYGVFRSEETRAGYRSPLDLIKSIWSPGLFLSTGQVCKYHHIYPCLLKTHTTNGYYSASLQPGLRMIVLNSVMFSDKQKGYTNPVIQDQLEWLEAQLKEVESAHETALLVMHVPPGDNIYKPYFWSETSFWSYDVMQRFKQIIRDYHLSITGILAAHTHKDEIKRMGHKGQSTIAGVYLNPALSTSHGNAPAIRSYVVHRDPTSLRWDLLDYRTYYFTREKDGSILSHLLYRFQDYYCPNQQAARMLDCLDNVTTTKMKQYLSAGNAQFQEKTVDMDNMQIFSQKSVLHSKFSTWFR